MPGTTFDPFRDGKKPPRRRPKPDTSDSGDDREKKSGKRIRIIDTISVDWEPPFEEVLKNVGITSNSAHNS
jgi:hypothetical protein